VRGYNRCDSPLAGEGACIDGRTRLTLQDAQPVDVSAWPSDEDFAIFPMGSAALPPAPGKTAELAARPAARRRSAAERPYQARRLALPAAGRLLRQAQEWHTKRAAAVLPHDPAVLRKKSPRRLTRASRYRGIAEQRRSSKGVKPSFQVTSTSILSL
jgi:hypothetical protein